MTLDERIEALTMNLELTTRDVADLQKAIDGYQHYLKLTKVYADEIIRRTRQRQPQKILAGSKTAKNPMNPEI